MVLVFLGCPAVALFQTRVVVVVLLVSVHLKTTVLPTQLQETGYLVGDLYLSHAPVVVLVVVVKLMA